MKAPANALLWLAARLMPRPRHEWLRAMRAEAAHLSTSAALAWAAGALVTAFQQRCTTMITGNLRISRWVLVIELLLCFVPATIAWLDALNGPSGLIRLNGEVVQKFFLAVPGGTAMLLQQALTGLIGIYAPLALLAGLLLVVRRQPLRSRWLPAMLIAAPLLICLAVLAGIAFAGAGLWGAGVNLFNAFVLLGLLPIIGAVHLAWLNASPPAPQPLQTA